MLRLLVIVILILVVLSLLGIEVASIFNNKTFRENVALVWDWSQKIWTEHLREPTYKGWEILWERGLKPVFGAIFGLISDQLENSDTETATSSAP